MKERPPYRLVQTKKYFFILSESIVCNTLPYNIFQYQIGNINTERRFQQVSTINEAAT